MEVQKLEGRVIQAAMLCFTVVAIDPGIIRLLPMSW
jgi:hypothetical protein